MNGLFLFLVQGIGTSGRKSCPAEVELTAEELVDLNAALQRLKSRKSAIRQKNADGVGK